MKQLLEFDLKFLIILILSAFLFFEKCDNKNDDNKQTIKIDGNKYRMLKYKIDTFEVYKTKTLSTKGDDIYFENYSVDTAYFTQDNIVDTAAILYDYFSKNVYKDTLKFNDSLGYVYIIDTITKNKIINRTWTSMIKEGFVKENTIVKKPEKAEYYFGLNANFDNKDYLNSFGASAMLKNKNNNILQLNVGLSNEQYTTQQLTPYIGGGIYWKLGKK